MSLNLTKGGALNLTKESPSTKIFAIGLSWQTDADADVSAFELNVQPNANPVLVSEGGVCFYNQKITADGAIQHSGDSRTGGTGMGGSDDETILFHVDRVAANVNEVSIICTIADSPANGVTFGEVKNATIRVYDADTGTEFAKFALDSADVQDATAVHFGSLTKDTSGNWSFGAVGEGFAGKNLEDFIHFYGPQVATVGHG
jgi:tellurium resistance protein TerD